MSFRQNDTYTDLITKDQTAGLPLFQNNIKTSFLPPWIWDGSKIKAEVYNSLANHLSRKRLSVLIAFIELGGEATDNEIKDKLGWPINWVTGRRNELVKMGLIIPKMVYNRKRNISVQIKKEGRYGAPNGLWRVNFEKVREI